MKIQGQGRCLQRSEVFVKIQKKIAGVGRGGCERSIGVFVEIQKKKKYFGGRVRSGWGVGLGGVRLDVNEELKFL